MFKSWYTWLFSCMVLFMQACGNNTADGFGDTLRQPLYAGLTDSIDKSPKDATLYLRRAELLSQHEQHDIAYYDYKKSWELNPLAETALAYASNLFLTGRTKDAITLLTNAAQQFPGNTEFLRRLGETYAQNGRTREALDIYDKLLKTDSGNFDALYQKGILYTQLKDTAKAIALLEQAYRLQPLTQTGLALANLYAETKNDRVIALCDALSQKDTARDFADPVFLKGIYYSNIRNYPKALALMDEAINRDWRFPDPYIEKGIILYEQKNYDEALKTFQYAANLAYTDGDNYYWMGRCYEATGKNEEAIDYYYKALVFDKDLTEAREGLKRLKAEVPRGE
ncbi:MAG: tetratricopeptide repeat protein [Bacteroidota bacterium]|nr:tetratricopeptide repeat protein [Bacteroidota bacterium]